MLAFIGIFRFLAYRYHLLFKHLCCCSGTSSPQGNFPVTLGPRKAPISASQHNSYMDCWCKRSKRVNLDSGLYAMD